MTVWAVIPVSPLSEGKSRLASVLDAPARRRLNQCFLEKVLGVATSVVGPARTLVVSRCAEALAVANDCGAATLKETGAGGLNPALEQAAAYIAGRGATALLALPADLPLVAPADLEALIRLARRRPGVVLAGDRAGTGTNALLVRPPGAIDFRFGPRSRAAHLGEARRRGLEVRTLRRPGLAFDIDTPADYARLRALAPAFSHPPEVSRPRRSAPSCRAAPAASGWRSRA
jgi:2-phospho-L-lactate guanylyltransferase